MLNYNEMYRTCTKCGVTKPLSDFSFMKSGKYCKRCKDCNYSDYMMKNHNTSYIDVSKYLNNSNESTGMPLWILRNLKLYGNCCINKRTYDKYAEEIEEIAIKQEEIENCYKIVIR